MGLIDVFRIPFFSIFGAEVRPRDEGERAADESYKWLRRFPLGGRRRAHRPLAPSTAVVPPQYRRSTLRRRHRRFVSKVIGVRRRGHHETPPQTHSTNL